MLTNNAPDDIYQIYTLVHLYNRKFPELFIMICDSAASTTFKKIATKNCKFVNTDSSRFSPILMSYDWIFRLFSKEGCKMLQLSKF